MDQQDLWEWRYRQYKPLALIAVIERGGEHAALASVILDAKLLAMGAKPNRQTTAD